MRCSRGITDDPAFAPDQASSATVAGWTEQAEQQLTAAFAALDAQTGWDDAAAADLATVLAGREPLTETVRSLARSGANATLTRIHGDLHLGQVLVANGDVYIIDFEGEPAKPMAARRAKNHRLARRGRHDPFVRLRSRGGEAEEPSQPGARRGP